MLFCCFCPPLVGPTPLEVDDDWILIPSASLAPCPRGSDCLPRNTYILVPVTEAARLGALFAAGPGGNKVIQVRSQGPGARLMRKFCIGPAMHDLTATHPLRVMRSGNWIQEQASTLQVGDIVNTSDGMKKIESLSAPRVSSEEVFSLDVRDGGEAYVFTPTRNADGQMSWSGVAVLGSMEKAQRSRSAPPRWPSALPSEGSRLCKGEAHCSNVCRNFKRGKCADGVDCRFCHLPHPEESKRQPRGPRDTGSSRSA